MNNRLLGSLIFILILLFVSSCCYDTTSELVTYVGKIRIEGDTLVDTSINIYMTNSIYYLPENKSSMWPKHPSIKGDFYDIETTESHCVNKPPLEHWECGPLRILIEGESIVTYFDSLSNDQLKQLTKNAGGEWILPVITLQKRN